MLQQGRVGEVLFANDIDSPRRERATTSLTLLVRCVRSGKGGFIRWFSRDLGCRPPNAKINTKGGALMEIECLFYFKLRRKPKTKKVTVVVDEQ